MRAFKWVVNSLYVFLPLAFLFHFLGEEWATFTFFCSALAIVPLAALMGHATEALAARAGAGVGAFLNAALGNAAELIIAVVAVYGGQIDLVKASLTGSIIGNVLLVLGLSAFLGGLRRKEQEFSRVAAESGVAMLFIAVAALSIPSLVNFLQHEVSAEAIQPMSNITAVVLMVTYLAGLIFVFVTHKHVFVAAGDAQEAPGIGKARIALELIVSAALIGVLAEFLVGTVEHASQKLGLSEIFIGVIVVAIVGNVAEHAAAIVFALKNKMNLSVNIAIESSKQVALFVAPLVVLVGLIAGNPVTLVFTPLEAGALGISVAILALLVLDGRTNWLEGVQLLAVYVILAVAFYFAT